MEGLAVRVNLCKSSAAAGIGRMYECNRPQNAGRNGRNEATLRYAMKCHLQKSAHSERRCTRLTQPCSDFCLLVSVFKPWG